jgi:hypothetical protein
LGVDRADGSSVRRRPASEFVQKVHQEYDVVSRLPRLSSLGRQQRHDVLAVRGDIEVLEQAKIRESYLDHTRGWSRMKESPSTV